MQNLLMEYQTHGKVSLDGYAATLDSSLFTVHSIARSTIAITADNQTVIAIDTVLTPELMQEGAYRELLRMCQVFRKESNFRIEQTIKLALYSEDSLMQAVIARFGESLCSETLADSLSTSKQNYRYLKDVNINHYQVTIEME